MLIYSSALSYLQYGDILIYQEIYLFQRCWKLDTRKYSKSPDIYQGRGVGSQASMDDPGMFRVSRDIMDTLTGGVGSQASMDDPGMFHILP